ncbi:hypothetical protein MF271_11590 [Deinococcus sp. KNUC1210]|uniref:hypothetical protein n=1 Tax=Deinococcus sp. KNUC1210 TaxID=2917691 RepID=UPI001EF01195|nr:hypothetical protein [Deinococcus sp. KNUC1210]ULH14650.1 hypothetical protein MF271_11590 [Deinococcus sp. KNUC1210]
MTEAVFERVQLGVRMEKRLVKVLKALAEKGDMSFAELLEDIVLHALEAECTFSSDDLPAIQDFKRLYGMTYGTHEHYAHPNEGAGL